MVMVDGGGSLNLVPAKSVSVQNEEDLLPLAEDARGVVPYNSRQNCGRQGTIILPALPYIQEQ